MANPTKITDEQCAFMDATTSDQSIDVDDYRFYTVSHAGVDATGAASTAPIVFSYDRTTVVSNDYSAASNKLLLFPGASLVVSKGAKTLAFKAIGASASFNLIPMEAI